MQKIVEGLQEAKYQKLPVRVQGPFGGHAMSRVELHATRKLLVFSGGFGITTVLPMLQRLALHRERRLSEAGIPPTFHVSLLLLSYCAIHSCITCISRLNRAFHCCTNPQYHKTVWSYLCTRRIRPACIYGSTVFSFEAARCMLLCS